MKRAALSTTAAAILTWLAAQEPNRVPVEFEKDVLPILDAHCFSCHGSRVHKAGLRLDQRAAAFAGSHYGKDAVIVPGSREESELWLLVSSEIEDERMPPADSDVTPLSAEQIAILGQWLDEGALWPDDGRTATWPAKHWAYDLPHKPPVPQTSEPAWVRNPLDAFLLQGMNEHGLSPSPEADRATLLRRASLDLIGLPPHPQELDDFLTDPRPDAWHRAVQRLLASPHYGEKQARWWLDLARYADSDGYEKDGDREMSRWREWVIDAFNADLPYDQFTIQQLAGDLLPNATPEQILATGFHRNTMLNEEGGVDPEEFRVAAVNDRVGTTASVWLGSTLACARCHDHKYDPISQKEYYRVFAVFNNTDDGGQGMGPTVEVPTQAQAVEIARIQSKLSWLRESFSFGDPALVAAFTAWEFDAKAALARPAAERSDFSWVSGHAAPPASIQEWAAALPSQDPTRGAVREQASDGVAQHHFEGAEFAPVPTEGDSLFVEVWLDPERPPRTLMLKAHQGGSWEHRAYWGEDLIDVGGLGTESFAHHAEGALPELGKWVRLELPLSAIGLMPGQELDGLAFTQHSGRVLWADAGAITAAPEVHLRLPSAIAAALLANDDVGAQARARTHWNATAPETAPLRSEIAALEAALPHPVKTMVLRRRTEPRETHLMIKGSFLAPGELVTPGVPAALKSGKELIDDRLAFARWLVDAKNPLTARVIVNRVWHEVFGAGLVTTVEDFGTQGAAPSHPELLDWLACWFMEEGWSIKGLHALLLESATYGQSSVATPEMLAMDPSNRWLARASRLRLPAEEVRDVALAASGLLVEQIGGPSVMPFQPAGVDNAPYAGDRWRTASDSDRFRRGIYTFWRRSAPYATFAAFDAPSREFVCTRRARSNTPLQALALLNDPAYWEMAEALGRRMRTDTGGDDATSIAWGFMLCTSRPPESEEARVLQEFLTAERAAHGDEDQAWSLLANVLLNLEETIVKG